MVQKIVLHSVSVLVLGLYVFFSQRCADKERKTKRGRQRRPCVCVSVSFGEFDQ